MSALPCWQQQALVWFFRQGNLSFLELTEILDTP